MKITVPKKDQGRLERICSGWHEQPTLFAKALLEASLTAYEGLVCDGTVEQTQFWDWLNLKGYAPEDVLRRGGALDKQWQDAITRQRTDELRESIGIIEEGLDLLKRANRVEEIRRGQRKLSALDARRTLRAVESDRPSPA